MRPWMLGRLRIREVKSQGKGVIRMNKCIKLIAAALLCLALVPVAQAQWVHLPTDNEGLALNPEDAPCVPFHINDATGTVEVLIAGTAGATGNTVTKTYGYINWIQLSTGTPTIYLDVKDTDKTGGGQVYNMLPPLMFRGAALTAGNYDTNKLQAPLEFHPPIRFQNGLAAKLSAAGVAATVCYRKLTAQRP